MKHLIILSLFFLFITTSTAQIISERGYPEHFIGGAIIGGTVSYLTFKKTDNKLIAWGTGFLSSAAAGLLKEWVDPALFNGTRNKQDVLYTMLGGGVGASIVIPLRSRKDKRVGWGQNRAKNFDF